MFQESVKDCYHVYSDGKRADIPFARECDKIFAMNSIAITAYDKKVSVLCLEVNDTHLHVVIRGEGGQEFVKSLNYRLTRYLNKESCSGDFCLSADPIGDKRELLTKIVYTFRNCLDFYNLAPWNYRWGVGNIYFAEPAETLSGQRLDKMSYRTIRKLFHTTMSLPGHWVADTDGLLLPSSYVDKEYVEQCFGSVRAYLAFLYVRKEDEQAMKQQLNFRYHESRNIETLRLLADNLCRSQFGKSIREAGFQTRLKIASSLIATKECGKGEALAKAVYLKKEDLIRLL